MSEGPIPWTAIYQFAKMKGLDEEQIEIFIQIMRRMDAAYLAWRGNKTDEDLARARRRAKQGR